ncbi:MAG TPA: STAS domain-containing protein [Thermoleophilaceae bacterium]|nr:STAS domain-containing protein [Thermoleophilaceae bacterium]
MPVSEFQIVIEQRTSGVTRVRICGEADIRTAPEIQERLGELAREPRERLLIDLSEATFLDSTALAVLLETDRRLRARRGRLAVLCPDPAMRELFVLVGHNLIFPVEETEHRALRHLTGRRRLGR